MQNKYQPYQTSEGRACHAILRRRSPKHHDYQSDFVGDIVLEDPRFRYAIGVTVRTGRDGEQELYLYLRPLHLYKTPVEPGKLEVVRP
jgi:hypothetical protein